MLPKRHPRGVARSLLDSAWVADVWFAVLHVTSKRQMYVSSMLCFGRAGPWVYGISALLDFSCLSGGTVGGLVMRMKRSSDLHEQIG
jgi:hypothetical protein